MASPPLVHVNILRTSGLPILRQLRLEEYLFRGTTENWFLINDGTPQPAIVLGLSGRPDELIDLAALRGAPDVEVIRRYSGGGTVIVDHNTIFTSIIMNGAQAGTELFPVPLMQWSEAFFKPALRALGDFSLRENDYVIGGSRKFGGNAQAISKGRFVHHTSFLWDYEASRMRLLRNPKKQPAYREQRPHSDFLVKMKEAAGEAGLERRQVVDLMISLSRSAGFAASEASLADVEAAVEASDHLRSTKQVPREELWALQGTSDAAKRPQHASLQAGASAA